MNTFMDAQCKNIIALVSTFEMACEMAAKQDDGKISKEEAVMLKKIRGASQKFKTEIGKL